jgi:hypothetical protein
MEKSDLETIDRESYNKIKTIEWGTESFRKMLEYCLTTHEGDSLTDAVYAVARSIEKLADAMKKGD